MGDAKLHLQVYVLVVGDFGSDMGLRLVVCPSIAAISSEAPMYTGTSLNPKVYTSAVEGRAWNEVPRPRVHLMMNVQIAPAAQTGYQPTMGWCTSIYEIPETVSSVQNQY